MKNPFLPLLFVLFLSATCTKNEEPSSDLDAEAEKWASFGFKNYDFTLQITCFCKDEFTRPKTIEVRENTIITVSGVPIENPSDSPYRTIDEFFIFIKEQRKQNPVVEDIKYDDQYGFPSYIYFDISEMIADEEIGYTLTDFVPYK